MGSAVQSRSSAWVRSATMSRALSSPDRDAHHAGRDAGGEPLGLGQLAVDGAAGVDGEGAHVADVGHLAHPAGGHRGTCVSHPVPPCSSIVTSGPAPRGEVPGGGLVVQVARESGVAHSRDGGMRVERLRDGLRVPSRGAPSAARGSRWPPAAGTCLRAARSGRTPARRPIAAIRGRRP